VRTEEGVPSPVPTGGIESGEGAVPPPQRKFLNGQVKNAVFMHFIAKNYLWPETRTGGLIDPLGAEDVKCRGGVKI